MKILFEINHPAEVHFFKNLIFILKNRGVQFQVSARNKDVTLELLKDLTIPFINRGKGANSVILKIFLLPVIVFNSFIRALKFKPDLFVSFASPYIAPVAFLLRKPHIAFDDTEAAKHTHRLYRPFTKTILSPSCYCYNFHKNQLFFNSYKELAYLHPKYLTPDVSVLNKYDINSEYPFVILRFTSWSAVHDLGQNGLTLAYKIKLVKSLTEHAHVYISSESVLQKELEKYRLNIKAIDLHHILSFAALYIGEGASTASECAVLGVPAILVNSLTFGYCKEQEEKFGLCHHFKSETGVLEKAIEILNNKNVKEEYSEKKNLMLKEKIDISAFMLWFIENYPQSAQIMKENPDYQYRFL